MRNPATTYTTWFHLPTRTQPIEVIPTQPTSPPLLYVEAPSRATTTTCRGRRNRSAKRRRTGGWTPSQYDTTASHTLLCDAMTGRVLTKEGRSSAFASKHNVLIVVWIYFPEAFADVSYKVANRRL